MKDTTRPLLEKAARSIKAAERLLECGDTEFAAGRAYYAMFYVAEALLSERGLRFSKHAGVHSAYGEHFAKTGALDPTYHRWLLSAFNKRIAGDYGVEASFTKAEVREMVEQAYRIPADSPTLSGISAMTNNQPFSDSYILSDLRPFFKPPRPEVLIASHDAG